MPAVATKQLLLPMAGVATAEVLLAWYDRERRDLPWRRNAGGNAGAGAGRAYRVWLSEIMLQQTTVAAVLPYYRRFLARWPTLEALAAAPRDEVLAAWAGLGYYSRARHLHACAQMVVARFGGRFPESEAELRALPGIGPYTAAAIAAIAFGARTTPVDANVERVVARLFGITEPLPAARARIRRLAASLTPAERAGDFAQALMDLGASECTAKRPSCLTCPVSGACAAHARGLQNVLPFRSPRACRPLRRGFAFLALREDAHILLRRRPEAGLLGGMLEVPSTAWVETLPDASQCLREAPLQAEWWVVPGLVVHAFTHFRLELSVYRALVPAGVSLTFWSDPERCRWVERRDLDRAALPTVMRKIIAHGLGWSATTEGRRRRRFPVHPGSSFPP
jgi:A/G-specific adenine glycosylase